MMKKYDKNKDFFFDLFEFHNYYNGVETKGENKYKCKNEDDSSNLDID